jgi:hypothetical protein
MGVKKHYTVIDELGMAPFRNLFWGQELTPGMAVALGWPSLSITLHFSPDRDKQIFPRLQPPSRYRPHSVVLGLGAAKSNSSS